MTAACVALALLAGCGRGGESAASTTTTVHSHAGHDHDRASADHPLPALDPCTLVTEAEAATVLGPVAAHTEVSDPILGTSHGYRVCVISLQRNPKIGANLGFADFESGAKFNAYRHDFAAGVEEVDSLGEPALWLGDFRLLAVLDDPRLIVVQMTDIFEKDKSVAKAKALELAKIALGRLPSAGARG